MTTTDTTTKVASVRPSRSKAAIAERAAARETAAHVVAMVNDLAPAVTVVLDSTDENIAVSDCSVPDTDLAARASETTHSGNPVARARRKAQRRNKMAGKRGRR